MENRIIFHVDVNNAFLSWTAVELLKNGCNLDIREIPSIIGGDEHKRQGVVLAKSPIAKKYGIKTADTIYNAKQKCPFLKIYSPDFKIYYIQSKNLVNYLEKYSPIIEQFSIDECFLDMTGTKYLYNDYLKLAYKIKDDIYKLYGFTVNIGIGNNKLCAKMASDFEKPNKVHTLFKNEIEKKLWPLDVEKLFMCGKSSKKILNEMKIYTIKDLAHADSKMLQQKLKSQGKFLQEAAWGIDNSKVETTNSKNKSISTTETLPFDLDDEEKIKEIIFRQTLEVTHELRSKKLYTKTVAVIYKNKDFISYSAQTKLPNPTDDTKEIYKKILEVFDKSFKREAIRLIGVRLSDLKNTNEKQLSLFDINQEIKKDETNIQKTMDNINKKFGKSIVAPASLKVIGNFKSKHQYKS